MMEVMTHHWRSRTHRCGRRSRGPCYTAWFRGCRNRRRTGTRLDGRSAGLQDTHTPTSKPEPLKLDVQMPFNLFKSMKDHVLCSLSQHNLFSPNFYSLILTCGNKQSKTVIHQYICLCFFTGAKTSTIELKVCDEGFLILQKRRLLEARANFINIQSKDALFINRAKCAEITPLKYTLRSNIWNASMRGCDLWRRRS